MNSILPLLILCSLMLIACGETLNLSAQQKQGKRIYESMCDKCHQLIAPQKHSDTEWRQAVNRYGIKLKLQQLEKDAIVAYLSLANNK